MSDLCPVSDTIVRCLTHPPSSVAPCNRHCTVRFCRVLPCNRHVLNVFAGVDTLQHRSETCADEHCGECAWRILNAASAIRTQLRDIKGRLNTMRVKHIQVDGSHPGSTFKWMVAHPQLHAPNTFKSDHKQKNENFGLS